jgi:SUN domain-containing protein 1/2
MSHANGMGAPTPRRSTRLSHAGSVTGQSVLTAVTTGGTKQRKNALTKVKNRKSNAYGAGGRVGEAEDLTVAATGFAEAFQDHRIDAVGRDQNGNGQDDINQSGPDAPFMSGALSGEAPYKKSEPEPKPGITYRVAPSQVSQASDGITPTDNGLESILNTSKSFGYAHESGMLPQRLLGRPRRGSAGMYSGRLTNYGAYSDGSPEASPYGQPWPVQHPVPVTKQASLDESISSYQPSPMQRPVPASNRASLNESIDQLVAEEVARAQRPITQSPEVRPRRRKINVHAIHEWVSNILPEGFIPEINEQEWSWHRFFQVVFWVFVSLPVLAGLVFLCMPRSECPESAYRIGLPYAVIARMAHAHDGLVNWILPTQAPPPMSEAELFYQFHKNGDDNYMWGRMSQIDRRNKARFDTYEQTLQKLSEQLPQLIVVRRREDGTAEISDEFWQALISKTTAMDNVTWTEFLKANENKTKTLFSTTLDMTNSADWPEAVSRKEFLETMQASYDKLSTEVDAKIFEAINRHSSSIKELVQTETKKVMVDTLRLQSLAQSNLIANYELTLQKANYFSRGLGAVVIPALTSATFFDKPGLLSKVGRRLSLVRRHNPPAAALESWEEPGDCWCAAPNPGLTGQAQLAVALARPMFPKQVTIEHLPMGMMPGKKITNAPRDVEIWVETKQTIRLLWQDGVEACLDGPAGWACLGTFRYNIHAANHQQTFDLDVKIDEAVSKVMVRVAGNWGADHTCLYRVRLHGADVVEDHVYRS